ncbi:MAG: T9SS C-terminal target domain-containing protein [Ignavibacteriales bacterium]|nr:MAG: T9SS C-terminal target domain-containing protein [Ignavibacteriales bacterium]
MIQKKLTSSILFLIGLGILGLRAQEAIPAAGGNASGRGGSVSYSIGQLVYTSNLGNNGSVSKGVQQPYEISISTGLKEVKSVTLQCIAYPNPASDVLTLKIENFLMNEFSYQLYDLNGKILETSNVLGNETNIIMKNRIQGTYLLKVIQSDKEIKSFKIIKK